MVIRQLPWTFLAVVAAAVFLTIFFGAWAVSADIGGRYDELLPPEERGRLPSAASPLDANAQEGEAWWEQSILFACPFH